MYQENGIECCYLVSQEGPGVATITIVNTCKNQVIVKKNTLLSTVAQLESTQYWGGDGFNSRAKPRHR